MRRTASTRDLLPSTFQELCRLHWPRPIHDSTDYENTAEIVDRLALLRKRTPDQDDYLEALSTMIEKYDKDLLADLATGAGAAVKTLKYLMEGHNMSASDLGRLLGNRPLGAAILRGDRKVSRANAQVIGDHFKLNPALFFQA